MQVQTIMTAAPTTISAQANLEEALEVMGRGSFRHLLVVDDGKLLGVLSDRDVLAALGRVPRRSVPEHERANRPGLVADVMTSDVRTVSAAEAVDVAAAVFARLGVGCLPVVQDEQVTGIITEMDLAGVFDDLARAAGLGAGANPPISERMTANVVSVGPTMSIQDASSTCWTVGARHLPVMEDGRLVGIVSDRDLRAAATHSGPEALTLADLMSTRVHTIASTEPLAEAARRMVVHKITTLPVVDDEQLVGIVSISDILGHCTQALAASDS